MPSRVLSAKLPDDLVERFGAVAAERGVTRNRLVREALEAAVAGRVTYLTSEERESQRLQAVRERIEHDRAALRQANPLRSS